MDNVVGWFKRPSDGAVIVGRSRRGESAFDARERISRRHKVTQADWNDGLPGSGGLSGKSDGKTTAKQSAKSRKGGQR